MNSKKPIAMILLLLVLLAMPVQVFAEGSVTVEIPFTVNGAPATVVMEAQEAAPAPETDRFVNTAGGTFRLSFSEAGTYQYAVYQEPGPDETLEYEGTIFDVQITIEEQTDGTLASRVEISRRGNAHKVEAIVFTNPPGMRIEKDQQRNDGSRTKERVWGDPNDKITYYITVVNGSTSPVYDVAVLDAIPEGMTLVPGSISDGGGEVGGVIFWQLGELTSTSSRTVHFTVTVPTVNERTIWTNIAEGSYADAPAEETVAHAETRELTRHELTTNEVETIYIPGETPPTPTPTPTPTDPMPTPPPTAIPTPRPDGTLPKTGDGSDPALWLGLLSVSALGITAAAILLNSARKRRG